MQSEASYLVKSLFLQGSYSACIATAKSETSPNLAVQLYAARSLIALGQTDEAATWLSTDMDEEDVAVKCAILLNEASTGESVLEDLQEALATAHPDEGLQGMVYAIAGVIYQMEGEIQQAMSLWLQGYQNLHDQECVALSVQQWLLLDRIDKAQQVYAETKPWLEDSLVSQLCEAWIGLKTGGEAYQAAFYTFDEIAQLPSANNVVVLQGKAVSQACMGNWPEAEAALLEAIQVNAEYPDSYANQAAMAIPGGKAALAHTALTKLKGKSHPILEDLAHKSGLFDEAASRFAPAVASTA